jgi:hypothetical protein
MRTAGERSGHQGGNPLETDREYGRERQGGGGGNSRSEHTINARTRAGKLLGGVHVLFEIQWHRFAATE